MPRYYFDCLSDEEVIADGRGTNLPDLGAVRAYAMQTARSIIAAGPGGDWTHWVVEVSAASGQTVLVFPFAEALASA